MSKVDELKKYEDGLLSLKADGNLNQEGLDTLDAIQKGAFNNPIVGNVLQGTSFGTSDEIGAYINSYLNPNLSYEDALLIEKSGVEQAQKDRPILSYIENMAGSIVPTAVTRGRNLGNFASGALYGGGYAYGTSEADDSLLSAKRLPDAAAGAATGAVVAPVTNLLLKPVANLSSNVKKLVEGPKRIGQIQARKLIQEAIDNESQSVEEAILYVINKNNSGKPYTLADLGENPRALLDATKVLPGKGKPLTTNFLKQRNSGKLARLSTDLQKAFGREANYYAEFNALEQARKSKGDFYYNRAYKSKIKVTDELQQLLKRPSIQRAFQKSLDLAKEEGKFFNVSVNENGQIITKDGSVVKRVPTRFLHTLKMGLDDEIYNTKFTGAGKNILAASKSTKNALLNIMDEQNNTYKLARNFWSGSVSVADAMTLGNTFLTANHNELGQEIFNMSASELEGFRLGAMQAMINEIERGSETTAVSRLLRSPARIRLIKMTFPQSDAGAKSAEKFINRLKDEVTMLETGKTVLGNSATAARQVVVEKIKDATENNPVVGVTDAISRAISKDFNNIEVEQKSEIAYQMAKILTETNPAKLKIIEKELSQKGIKFVAQKYLKDAAPVFLSQLINPSQAAAQAGQVAGRNNMGAVFNAPIAFGQMLAQQLMNTGNN